MSEVASRRQPGSVVGIQVEVEAMYTGTVISELIETVEHAEVMAEQQRLAEELREIFSMQIPIEPNESIEPNGQAYMGAA